MTPRLLLRLIPALFLLAVLGCGLLVDLEVYEKKMANSQDVAKRIDEEMILLDEPVKIPSDKVKEKGSTVENEVFRINLFLQPPKGISSKFNPNPLGEILFLYPRKPPPPPVPGQPQPAPGTNPPAPPTSDFLEVGLAWNKEKDKEADKKRFKEYILSLYRQKKLSPEEIAKLPNRTMPSSASNRLPIIFETYEFEDPQGNFCSVSFCSRDWPKADGTGMETHDVAIGYKVEKGKQQHAMRALELSRETLALFDPTDVVQARKVYSQRFPTPPPAAPPPGQTPPVPPPQPGVTPPPKG
jgi:hypothetical protein